MTDKEQKKAAKEFAARWEGKGYEKGESQLFWIDFLTNVLGVDDITHFISFEDKVMLDHNPLQAIAAHLTAVYRSCAGY